MTAITNKDYYNILLEACKEAFETLEQKDFLYTNEAMIENNEISFSVESIENYGIDKVNEMIVQYRLKEAVEYSFLTYLERCYLLSNRDMIFERKDFYRKCLTALNIEFTKFIKEGGRVPIGYNYVKNPDALLFLNSMKFHLKQRAEVPDKISQISEIVATQQIEINKTDELLKNESTKIFKNDIGFSLFVKMFELYKTEKIHLANFSFLFFAMEKEFLVCNQTDFKEFLRDEKYNIDIEKIDNRQLEWQKSKKTKLYNSIREQLQKEHEKSTS